MTVKSKSMDENVPIKIYDDRELILSKLNETINYLHNKAINGKIRDENKEKVKIQYFKALAYTCNVYNQIKRDIDIEELNKKIEAMTYEIKQLKELKEHEKRY